MIEQPHNNLFRFVLGQPTHAASLLRSALPPAVQQHLDFDSLRDASENLVGQDLGGSETDLLYRLRLREGGEAFVYVLLEHQSTVNPVMAGKGLRYVVDIWSRWRRSNQGATKLPVIIPLVLYHGERAWSAPRHLRALLAAPSELLDSLGPFVPSFSYIVENLAERSDAEILRVARDAVVELTMLLLKHGRSAEAIVPKLQRWLDLLQEVAVSPGGLQVLGTMIIYLYTVREDVDPGAVAELAQQLGPEASEEVMTVAERLRAEGEARGRAEGEARGEARGRAATLEKLITLRFGKLTDAARVHLGDASQAELDRLTERILTAKSLSELLE